MHPKFIVIYLLISHPALLFSQAEGSNIIVGGVRLDRLSYERSLDGVRKDIDLGINTKYLRSLFPDHSCDSIHYIIINDNEEPLSRHWAGVNLGFSGYYVNSDSAVIKATDISIGPIFRYYATKQLFLEATTILLYSWSQVRTVAPISSSNWYYSKVGLAGLKCQLGIGYSKRLIKNVFLEPMIGYQRYWRWHATNSNVRPYELYEISNNFIFSLSLQYSF